MLYRRHTPRWPLSDLIEILWLYEGRTTTHERERLLPTGTMEVVINLLEDEVRVYQRDDPASVQRFPGAVMIGPHSEYFIIDTAEQTSVAGIHFKPAGAFVLLRPPAIELHNIHVSLDDVWGRGARRLRERLLECDAAEDRFRVMEDCLMEQVARPIERHPGVEFALGQFGGCGIAPQVSEVADQIGLSSRRFIQVFSEQVGYTPKLYCRVQRFQQVLKSIHGNSSVDWADVALSCGYFDQAHFIRDFRDFSGITPTTYLNQHTDHLNHVPLPD